jgi:hypothetical protein
MRPLPGISGWFNIQNSINVTHHRSEGKSIWSDADKALEKMSILIHEKNMNGRSYFNWMKSIFKKSIAGEFL